MREITQIIIHCADTPEQMDIGAAEIKQWHLDRGWNDIGYHYVIRRNGVIERGRAEETVGAHVEHYNKCSIGVCLVGGKPDCNFTRRQWESLERLVIVLSRRYPEASVSGHRDFDSGKRCPCFNAKEWWNGNQTKMAVCH